MSNRHSTLHLAGALSCLAVLAVACTPTAQGSPEQDPQATASPAHSQPAIAGPLSATQAEELTRGWPEASRKAIKHMTDTYGPPATVGAGMAIWGETGPWKRTVVFDKEVPHHFPMVHPDVMQQWVNYEAPVDKYDDLARYDGSVVMERTTGEMSARCDKEPANFLAINLAHDVATGKRTVEDARMEYGKQVKELMAGNKSEYTSGIMFAPTATGAAGFKDEPLPMMKAM